MNKKSSLQQHPKNGNGHRTLICNNGQRTLKKQQFSNTVKRCKQLPINQRVWRKIIVLPKAKIPLPRLFCTDRKTGLPVGYERRVSRIMHYVNPQLSKSPCTEHLMEKLLAGTLTDFLESCCCTSSCPQYLNNQLRSILKGSKFSQQDECIYRDELSQFHCACKRGSVIPEPPSPTYKSKFNYNSLMIYSH
ncbi:GH10065 [Drosophila grimshawi]|uniref:GH10065 n=2 Tax=Drosophila grimshawi TaxID=7222 RepID=B4JD37_DROGR|nr:GH10065 [Drosophila grimshawi]